MLGGVPLVVRVYRAVLKSNLIDEAYVATDDSRIASAVEEFDGRVIMTSGEHPTGSDRAAEAVGKLGDIDLVINIQGDEPFISTEVIDSVVKALDDPGVVMSTACSIFSDPAEADDPNIVKVVLDRKGDALYFSRSRIPYGRAAEVAAARTYRHIGIYGYKRDFLMTFAALERTVLEKTESLEQLRALEHGYKIRTVIVEKEFPGIDSEMDLIKAEALLGGTERNDGR